MKGTDLAELIGLAALWGASFLFMRLGAGEFGPIALASLRVAGAALLLVPLLRWRDQLGALREHWKPIAVVGIVNSVLPFLCYSYAALSITAGLASIFNAATPLFGAAIAWWWLGDRLTPSRLLGLAIGFAGVLGLVWSNVNSVAGFKPGGSGWAVVACIAATVCYGIGANYTKKRLTGVPPLAVAAGSQLAAAIVLTPPMLAAWPAVMPSALAWLAVAALAFASTGLAYLLYFRLIAHVGPANAISVTFLIPVFAVLWGFVFLHETIDAGMLVGCLVIVCGTALATGFIAPRARRVA